jgi:hypothetical protein
VKQGIPVRLSGQDSRRATFNQRHSVLLDIEDETEYVPLRHIAPGQAACDIYNSPLSEAGVMGFEYGYSRDYPEALVLWEAQFGDFANVAQAVIDQFVCAGEDKWNLLSGLVLLLPHGYEGQGPEHSSARIERFLQLAARDNIQICQPSNAGQYFHLLRRQALRKWRKPLIVFTPKSMLRHPDALSPLEDLTHQKFLPVIPDTEAQDAKRILLCTGKIGHELRTERQKRNDSSTAIVFLEQMYPFPEAELTAELAASQRGARYCVGAGRARQHGRAFYMLPRLSTSPMTGPVHSVKRSASASPATGSAKAHEVEQKTLLALAFTTTETAGRAKEPSRLRWTARRRILGYSNDPVLGDRASPLSLQRTNDFGLWPALGCIFPAGDACRGVSSPGPQPRGGIRTGCGGAVVVKLGLGASASCSFSSESSGAATRKASTSFSSRVSSSSFCRKTSYTFFMLGHLCVGTSD